MNEKVQAASRLIASAILRDIRMISGHFACSINSAAEVEEPVMTIGHDATAERTDQPGFRVRAMLRLQIFEGKDWSEDQEGPESAAAEMFAAYELTYELPEDSDVPDDALDAFAETNGVFNAWPYFREFAQSSAARMGLPPVLVPLFRLSPPETSREPSETSREPRTEAGEDSSQ